MWNSKSKNPDQTPIGTKLVARDFDIYNFLFTMLRYLFLVLYFRLILVERNSLQNYIKAGAFNHLQQWAASHFASQLRWECKHRGPVKIQMFTQVEMGSESWIRLMNLNLNVWFWWLSEDSLISDVSWIFDDHHESWIIRDVQSIETKE